MKDTLWFQNAPLGIFIHWGIYSALGRGEWVLNQEQMTLSEYDSHIPEFTAENFDPDRLAALAKSAGAVYMVLTTKHHDGFCLFRTSTTHRNAFEQGPKRDLVADYVSACRRAGLRVGLYFSPPDWSSAAFNNGPDADPAAWKAYVDGLHTQVRELLSNYGKIDLLWYDRAGNMNGRSVLTAENLRSIELNEMVHELQPDILINDRSCVDGDFYTAEQNLAAPKDPCRLWEGCLTMNSHWGYFPADIFYKPPFKILWDMTGVASAGGHLLLNIGPDRKGVPRKEEVKILRKIGEWLKVNGEAVSGMSLCTLSGGSYGCAAQKDGKVYLYVHWPNDEHKVVVPHCTEKFSKAVLLRGKVPLRIEYDAADRMIVSGLPETEPGDLPVIRLER